MFKIIGARLCPEHHPHSALGYPPSPAAVIPSARTAGIVYIGRKSLTAEGVDAAALQNALATIDEHLKAEKPGLLKSALAELQKVVGKATGGLVAQGVLAMLHQILGTGVPA